MYTFREFLRWFTQSSDKAEKLEFKSQREAAEFVRRIYNQNGAPNQKLRDLYNKADQLERDGRVIKKSICRLTGRIIVQPFDRTRSRNTFECGRRGIDQWYRNHSKKWSDRAEARITIAVDEDTNAVAGFHALQIGSESMAELENKPDDHTKNYTAFPALHLAYLGVQKRISEKGCRNNFTEGCYR